ETVPDPITAAENRVLNGQGAERLLEVQQEAAKAGGSDQDYASALEKAASQPPPEKPAEDPAAAAKVALGPQYAHLVTGLEASGTDSHIAAGLEAAAPDLLTLRGTDLDLAEPLGRALSELPALRASGLPADKYLQQAQTTGDDPEQPEADLILGRLAHAKSPEDVSQFLRQYVASALQQKQADDARLAGAPENPDQGPVTPAGAAEADLSRSMSSVPSPDSTDRPEAGAPSAQSLGIIPSGRAAEMLSSIANGMKGLGHEITTVPHMDAFKTVLNDWHGERQMNTLRLRKIVSDLLRVVPNASAREGISNWLDAGGNMQTLKQWADATPSGSLKRGYEAALSLTPEQLETANNIRQYFVAKLAEGQREGIFPEFDSDGKPWEGIDNYISHIVRQPFVGGGAGSRFSGKLTRTFKFGGTRTFPNFHELEKAGLQAATKDVAEILATYSNEMDKTIQTRRLIKRLVQTKNEAGEALAQVLGGTITKDQGSAATFISPQFSQTRDDLAYRSLDHPALRNWRWVATDADGKPVMMLGELGLHPAIYPHLKNVLGRSAIREWYDQPGSTSNLALKATVKGLDNLNRTVANTMMGFISTFHPVHLAKRALIGNRINPFAFKQLDPADPMLQRAVKTGLALAGDNEAAQLFMDGFGAGSLTDKVPMIGALGRTYTNFI
ncbi:MAG TPA: hypothetical protein VG672_13715, partial [Bryobacteraceae bacterium]|nr:hypothetical protein [Bryobacteraceae bacterium]